MSRFCANHKATPSTRTFFTCPLCYASRERAEGEARGSKAACTTNGSTETKLNKEKKDLQSERQERAQQDSMEVGDIILKEANAKLHLLSWRIRILKRYLLLSTANTGMQQAREQWISVSKRKQSIRNTFLSQPSDPKCKKSSLPMWKTWNCDSEIY